MHHAKDYTRVSEHLEHWLHAAPLNAAEKTGEQIQGKGCEGK